MMPLISRDIDDIFAISPDASLHFIAIDAIAAAFSSQLLR